MCVICIYIGVYILYTTSRREREREREKFDKLIPREESQEGRRGEQESADGGKKEIAKDKYGGAITSAQ